MQAKYTLSNWIQRLIKYRSTMQRIGILLGAGLIMYQIALSLISILTKNVQFYHPLFLTIPMMLYALAAFQQMLAWKLIMKGLKFEIPLISVVQSYSYSFLPRYIPGTVWGYLSRAEWLFQQQKISYEETNLGSLVEVEIAVTSSLSIMGFYYFLLRREYAPPIIIGLLLLIFAPWLLLLAREKIKGQQIALTSALKQIGSWFLSLCLYIINGLYYGAGLLAVIQALSPQPIQISAFTLLTFSAFYSLAWLVSFIILFVPSGLGVREAILTSLVAAFLRGTPELANTSAVLMRLGIILFMEILWIGLGYWLKARKGSTPRLPTPFV